MADQRNIELPDEALSLASGGAHVDDYGVLGEGVVTNDSGFGKIDGVRTHFFSVDLDDGRSFLCVWDDSTPLEVGTRVRINHADSGLYGGFYVIELI